MTGTQHRTLTHWLFGVAVAALAAAFASPLVEWLSNRGAFGPGSFTDGSNADVFPVTVAGLLLIAGFLGVRMWSAFSSATGRSDRRTLTAALSSRTVVRLLPSIYLVQIAMLWTMETLEQHVVVGHAFGPTVWLGGPAAASLSIHALCCVAAAALARRLLVAVEPRAIRIVRALLALFAAAFGPLVRSVRTHRFELSATMRSPALRHIGTRGPPRPHLS